jgi:hypothetical protein
MPAAIGYQVLYAAAVSTLRPEHRELLRLPSAGRRVPQASAAALLAGLRSVLGQRPPAATVARRRLDRLDRLDRPERLERPDRLERPESA